MRRILKSLGTIFLIVGFGFGAMFLAYSLSQAVQGFILAYGFQLCICTILVALLIDKVGKRVPDGWTPMAEGSLFFYILGSILLSGCIFGLVFRSMWAESGWALWAFAFIFGLLSFVAAEQLRWQAGQMTKSTS